MFKILKLIGAKVTFNSFYIKMDGTEVEQTKTNAVSEEEVDQIEDAIKTIESKAAQYVANKKKTALDRHELMSLINQKPSHSSPPAWIDGRHVE